MSTTAGHPRDSLQHENEHLRRQIADLQSQLEEARETLCAIRAGEVDALVISGPQGDRVFTLQSAEQPYRLLIEQMREGAVMLLREGTIHYANRAFADLVERPLEQVLGSDVHAYIAPTDRLLFAGLLQQTRAGTARGEVSLCTARGALLPVHLGLNTMVVDGVESVCLMVTDLSERKHHEQQILELNAELEQRITERTAELQAAKATAEAANKAKDHFIAVLSHELRTPLSPALMLAATQERNGDLPAPLRADLQTIRRNIELEVHLIDDLLDLSRVMSGKMRMHVRPVSVQEVLRRALETCAADILSRNLQLHQEFAATADQVQADPARLQQVFWNLLKNAVKFTPVSGRIEVSCRNPAPGKVQVQVRDTGIGISSEALARIFDAFEQADKTITRQFGGLGLGLAISKGIVELHQGAIRATSPGEGQGATFTVELPVSGSTAATMDAPAKLPAGALPPLRLLLVEDHADTARILSRWLETSGHQVQIAGSVAEARAQLARTRFDLLLSDLGLPDGSGHEVMAEAKAKYGIAGICMSGYGMEADIEQGRHAGFAAHLTKPISLTQLEQVLAQFGKAGQQ